jgi:shikimate kinase
MIISLVGMPGCGKSTVGRHVARNMGWRFVDSDHEIEHRLGHTIKTHFERFGEASFRELEAEVIAEISAQQGVILATGGGAVLREANRQALKTGDNQVVYLRAMVDDLVRRLRFDHQRPLLQGVDPARRLRELFMERDPVYRQMADFTIDTGRVSVATMANLLAMQLELGLPLAPPAAPPGTAAKASG